MTGLVRQEDGVTLPEVLVVSLVLAVVLGAVLSVFEAFEKNNVTNQRLNDAQDSIRVSVDAITRELRNMASPTNELPQAIKRAEAHDLIWLSVAGNKPAGSLNSRNTRYVRYCLDDEGTLWRQQLTWTTASAPSQPVETACPGDTWPQKRVMASNVTNEERAVFSYNAAGLTSITEVGVSLFIDAYPGRSPKEVALQSAVFLRNQNRLPLAQFDSDVVGNTIVLNGSDSSDPEGRSLTFYWYDESKSTNSCGTLPEGVPTAGCVGTGIVFNYTTTSGNHPIHLIVADPAGLQDKSDTETECVGVGCP